MIAHEYILHSGVRKDLAQHHLVIAVAAVRASSAMLEIIGVHHTGYFERCRG
jgi:hypothetical protein